MSTIWKDIPGFSRYQANTQGEIKSKKYNKILCANQVYDKYITAMLINDEGESKTVAYHRLIASTFIPNPDNKPQVNHKDKDITNNKVDNLEWVTQQENIQHRYITEEKIKKDPKKSIKIDIDDTFKPCNVPGFEIYKISTDGLVATKTGRLLNGSFDKAGYMRICLTSAKDPITKKTTKFNTSIHRLVALTFIPNPDNKPEVNHKNGVKHDNRVDNLEWCTRKENIQHAAITGLKPKTCAGRTIYMLELNGIILNEFSSIKEAEKYLGFESSTRISAACVNYENGNDINLYQYAGYGWCWKESYKKNIINPMLKSCFPDINCDDPVVDYNKLRPYVIRGVRPVWKLKLDGTRIELCDRRHDTKIADTQNGYGWEYATYRDICIKNNTYTKKVNNVLRNTAISLDEKEIDLSNFTSRGKSQPIWEIDLDGKRVKKWASKSSAERELNINRGIIDNAIQGKTSHAANRIWEYATYFKDDDTDPKNYRIIPYSDRTTQQGKSISLKLLNQYDINNNLIATMKPKEFYKKYNTGVALSYKYQDLADENGNIQRYTFELTDKKLKTNKSVILQYDLNNNFIKEWDMSVYELAKVINCPRSTISAALNGAVKTAAGFIWKRPEIINNKNISDKDSDLDTTIITDPDDDVCMDII